MKRIITIILSAVLTITVSAQLKTPIDKIWEEIYSVVPEMPKIDEKSKCYYGSDFISYNHNGSLSGQEFCAKDSSENKKIMKKILGIIRRKLNSLMEFSEESDLLESHYNDADTIKFSICLSDGPVVPKKHKIGNMTYITPDDKETISFDYTRNKRNYEYRGSYDFLYLSYNKNVSLPKKQKQIFDKLSYLQEIEPVLKNKDIKSWDFYWSYNKDYYDKYRNSINTDIEYYSFLQGDEEEGKAKGTIYFIPKEKKELAETVLASLDSITFNYSEKNPDQKCSYYYNMKDWVMRFKEGIQHNIKEMFITGPQSSTHVFYGISPHGYYIAIADTEKNFCIPREWYALKSFDNGKKEYFKGAKK